VAMHYPRHQACDEKRGLKRYRVFLPRRLMSFFLFFATAYIYPLLPFLACAIAWSAGVKEAWASSCSFSAVNVGQAANSPLLEKRAAEAVHSPVQKQM
jgi:hypothetical protein